MSGLKFYKRHLEKKFPNLFTEAWTSRIIELPTENSFPIKIDQLAATTSKRKADDDNNIVSLESNDRYKLNGWTFDN